MHDSKHPDVTMLLLWAQGQTHGMGYNIVSYTYDKSCISWTASEQQTAINDAPPSKTAKYGVLCDINLFFVVAEMAGI